jgi:phenylalanyl-tRNA synthetase beta chain
MNISLNWLKQYVDIDDNVDPKELGLKLTLATVEVEEVIDAGETLENIFVGKVNEIKKHPDADKLQVVVVEVGDEKIEVVCGGSNLKQDMAVAFAKVGAKVRWHGEGELIELTKVKVRGVESAGMICASSEIGLGELFEHGETEILDLTQLNLTVGQPLASALGLDDVIYDIDNKSLTNRPDLWGHYGMAREVATIYNKKLKEYKIEKFKSVKDFDLSVKVENKDLCPRYLGVALKNIKIEESPEWLKKYLQSVGQRPINNIVDITNYIMHDLGQPLHAFSADKIKDNKIIVRTAKPGEKFTTLDGNEYKLLEEDLVIADKDKAVALAGVMGGENSQIDEKTGIVIIEAANFDPTTIRKTANRLDLRTDSSTRFEKSLDPNMAEIALRRAVNLIQELIPAAEVVSDVIDVKNFELNQGPIEISYDFINRRIGEELKKDEIRSTLTGLGFGLKESKDNLKIKIPTWRATKDVSLKEDIIEEIARIHGYDNLTPVMPTIDMVVPEENRLRTLERRVKEIIMSNTGGNEVCNYSFVEKELLEKVGQPLDHVLVENPVTESQQYMRKSLMPGLLDCVVNNLRFEEEMNLFEAGKVFLNDTDGENSLPDSENHLPSQPLFAGGAVVAGDKDVVFNKTKGIIELLFDKLNIKIDFEVGELADYWTHPKQSLKIMIGKELLGYISNVHPEIVSNFDIAKPVCVWTINLSKLLEYWNTGRAYQPISKYPAIELDVSMLVDETVLWNNIEDLVLSTDPNLIKEVSLFDVYKSDKIEAGKKSLAFRIKYHSDEKTLEMKDIESIHQGILKQLEKAVGAELRI